MKEKSCGNCEHAAATPERGWFKCGMCGVLVQSHYGGACTSGYTPRPLQVGEPSSLEHASLIKERHSTPCDGCEHFNGTNFCRAGLGDDCISGDERSMYSRPFQVGDRVMVEGVDVPAELVSVQWRSGFLAVYDDDPVKYFVSPQNLTLIEEPAAVFAVGDRVTRSAGCLAGEPSTVTSVEPDGRYRVQFDNHGPGIYGAHNLTLIEEPAAKADVTRPLQVGDRVRVAFDEPCDNPINGRKGIVSNDRALHTHARSDVIKGESHIHVSTNEKDGWWIPSRCLTLVIADELCDIPCAFHNSSQCATCPDRPGYQPQRWNGRQRVPEGWTVTMRHNSTTPVWSKS